MLTPAVVIAEERECEGDADQGDEPLVNSEDEYLGQYAQQSEMAKNRLFGFISKLKYLKN
jgi:hypothetical protein